MDRVKISRNMGMSQKSIARIFSQYFIRSKQTSVRNAQKHEANIWWANCHVTTALEFTGIGTIFFGTGNYAVAKEILVNKYCAKAK